MTSIGDANDPATILSDAHTFFSPSIEGGPGYFQATDDDEVQHVNQFFIPLLAWDRNFELLGRLTAALVQVYDLVLPFDGTMAEVLLRRLGAIAGALLANRDDKVPPPLGPLGPDPFRGRVMPAWGHVTPDRDGEWNTDVYSSGLLSYPMAAFARRVLDHPARYAQYQSRAFGFISAVIETYMGFLPELHLDESDPHAYFKSPAGYANLVCPDGEPFGRFQGRCQGYRDAGKKGSAIDFNENLTMMQALAECALAADSPLYLNSGAATPDQLRLARLEMPLVVAKNVAFFVDNLTSHTLPDGTPYFGFKQLESSSDDKDDTNHAGLSLACVAVIVDLQTRLDSLLARAGRTERIPFSTSVGIGSANTFLRKVWQNDNTLSGDVAGKDHNEKNNDRCTGFIPYAQFDQWVWRRALNTTFNPLVDPKTGTPTPNLIEANHGALLRYREFSSNSTKYLRDFAGQNWVITPAPLAAGESRPASIHDQKWLLILTGVVIADLRGEDGEWGRQTVSFTPDMAGPDDPDSTSGPLNWAINQYSISKPSGSPGMDYLIRFSIEEWSPFVAPNAMFNESQSMNCGFAVDVWRPNHFGNGTDVLTNLTVNNIFSGINADLAVREKDAWLHRLGYRVALLGKIVFVATSPPLFQRPSFGGA